jgi:hypothetical protein
VGVVEDLEIQQAQVQLVVVVVDLHHTTLGHCLVLKVL